MTAVARKYRLLQMSNLDNVHTVWNVTVEVEEHCEGSTVILHDGQAYIHQMADTYVSVSTATAEHEDSWEIA